MKMVPGGSSPDRLWQLRTSRGSYAIKQFFDPNDDQLTVLDDNIRFQRAAWEAGIPMPEPRLTADGRGAAAIPAVVTMHEWVGGPTVRYGESAASRRSSALQMATALAKLHTLDGPLGSKPPWLNDYFRTSYGKDKWNEYADRAEALGMPWAKQMRAAIPNLEFADSLIADPKRSPNDSMGHGDANPHNAIVRPNKQIAIVDWDGAQPVCAQEEFAALLTSWARGPRHANDRLAVEMIHAYRAGGGTFNPSGLDVFAMKVASSANWLNACAEIALDIKPHPRMTKEYASGQVEMWLDWAIQSIDEIDHFLNVSQAVN
jgi:aminoglycoside phosphotransferase (APT) family kinase protein